MLLHEVNSVNRKTDTSLENKSEKSFLVAGKEVNLSLHCQQTEQIKGM